MCPLFAISHRKHKIKVFDLLENMFPFNQKTDHNYGGAAACFCFFHSFPKEAPHIEALKTTPNI
jgi:hypothetical protein